MKTVRHHFLFPPPLSLFFVPLLPPAPGPHCRGHGRPLKTHLIVRTPAKRTPDAPPSARTRNNARDPATPSNVPSKQGSRSTGLRSLAQTTRPQFHPLRHPLFAHARSGVVPSTPGLKLADTASPTSNQAPHTARGPGGRQIRDKEGVGTHRGDWRGYATGTHSLFWVFPLPLSILPLRRAASFAQRRIYLLLVHTCFIGTNTL